MMGDSWSRLPTSYSHAQCLECQGGVEMGGNSVSNHFPGKGIQNGCQVDKAVSYSYVGDICQPYLVKPAHNQPFDQVGIPVEGMPAICCLYPPAFDPAEKVAFSH